MIIQNCKIFWALGRFLNIITFDRVLSVRFKRGVGPQTLDLYPCPNFENGSNPLLHGLFFWCLRSLLSVCASHSLFPFHFQMLLKLGVFFLVFVCVSAQRKVGTVERPSTTEQVHHSTEHPTTSGASASTSEPAGRWGDLPGGGGDYSLGTNYAPKFKGNVAGDAQDIDNDNDNNEDNNNDNNNVNNNPAEILGDLNDVEISDEIVNLNVSGADVVF
jgi:hypothetical protein